MPLFLILAGMSPFPARAEQVKADLTVERAWVRLVPPSANVTAAYMIVRNDGARPAYLVAAETPDAANSELHRMSSAGGMMSMAPVDAVTVPARGRAALEPEGFHLMLIGLRKPLRRGQKVTLTLHFRGKRRLTVVAEVRESAEAASGGSR
jgi:copper(I)-binding protein